MEKTSRSPLVVVVGGGLAGQSAAIEAANTGSQVVLLEKESKLGGNSAKATSGINGWGTRAQATQNIHDGGKYFERDTHKSGLGGSTDPGLVKMLSLKSADAIHWLTSLGVPLTVLSQLGGHSRKRTHRAPDKADGTPVPIGYTIMQTLEHHIRTNLSDRVTIIEGATVTRLLHKEILREDGVKLVRVDGVAVAHADGTKADIMADAVILATGGFSNDKTVNSLLSEYAPHLASFPTTNGPWATGDGVKLARELGVKLVDMDKVQLHPTGLINPKDPANPTKFLGPEALRGSGGVLLNKKGERFVNELDLRSVVSNAIIAQGDKYPGSNDSTFAYCVLNDAARTLFGVNYHDFYWKRLGLFVKAETVEELAKLIECPVENLNQTLGEYETLSKTKQVCPKTRKAVYPCVVGTQGPFYVAFVTPSVHYTMGGCLISPSAEMQIEYSSDSVFGKHRPVAGLFGAGEVTGGVHGSNRLGGNSLLECVVFGRIAGDRAGHILYDNLTYLWHNKWSKVTLRNVENKNGFLFFMFNLPSSLQTSGLTILQKVWLRTFSEEGSIKVFSPVSLPDEEGAFGVMWVPLPGVKCPEWLCALRPGDAVEARAGDAVTTKHIALLGARHIVVIATPHGAASMVQIIRATLESPRDDIKVRLIYIADVVSECPYQEELEAAAREQPNRFIFAFVLKRPTAQWTGGVDYKDEIAGSVLIDEAQSIFLCGEAEFMLSIKNLLLEMGRQDESIATIF